MSFSSCDTNIKQKIKGWEHAKGSETCPVFSLVGFFAHLSTRWSCFLMGLTSVTVSENLPQIVCRRWPGCVWWVMRQGDIAWCPPSEIRRHDGCIMKHSQYSSLILVNPFILYGNVLLQMTKFHPCEVGCSFLIWHSVTYSFCIWAPSISGTCPVAPSLILLWIYAEWHWMKIRTNLGIPRTVA